VYTFNPVPDSVDPKFILGGQANLWTEQVYNTRHMEYMLWPRSLAVAECLWSPLNRKNWPDFARRVEAILPRMDVEEVKYSRSMFDPIFSASKDSSGNLLISLSTEIEGIDLYYSFDNSNPDRFYPKYATPLSVPKDASLIKVVSYRDGKPIGRQLDMPIAELIRRAERRGD
jgi:hexosaminidase